MLLISPNAYIKGNSFDHLRGKKRQDSLLLETWLADVSTALHVIFAYSSVQALLRARKARRVINASIRIANGSERVPHGSHILELVGSEFRHAAII